MMNNEKFEKSKLNDKDLEKVAGGTFDNNLDIFNVLNDKFPDIGERLSNLDNLDDHNVLKGVLCGLLNLDPQRTVISNDNNTPNVYVTNDGKTLTDQEVCIRIVDLPSPEQKK